MDYICKLCGGGYCPGKLCRGTCLREFVWGRRVVTKVEVSSRKATQVKICTSKLNWKNILQDMSILPLQYRQWKWRLSLIWFNLSVFLLSFLRDVVCHFVQGGYKKKQYPLALVIAPTRELASQIYDEARKVILWIFVGVSVAGR